MPHSMSDRETNDDWTDEGDLGLGLRRRRKHGLVRSDSESVLFHIAFTDHCYNGESENSAKCAEEDCQIPKDKSVPIPGNDEPRTNGYYNYAQATASNGAGGISWRQQIQRVIQKCFSISKCKENSLVQEDDQMTVSSHASTSLAIGPRCESCHSKELIEAHQQICLLSSELEIYRQLLQDKTRASKILLAKISILQDEVRSRRNQKRSSDSELYYQVNKLQYELQCSEDHLTDAQQIWLQRFNSVTENNEELKKRVKDQEEKIRTMIAEKDAVKCERDELLGLIDYKERRIYQRSSSLSLSNDEESNAIPVELAVLGACVCRGPKQEPCQCARSASLKQRRLLDVQKKLEQKTKHVEEVAKLLDSHRSTLEEEQERNRALTKRLLYLEAICDPSKSSKTLFGKHSNQTVVLSNDILNMLSDVLCDKTEAMENQRFIIRVLARRILELEELVKQNGDDS